MRNRRKHWHTAGILAVSTATAILSTSFGTAQATTTQPTLVRSVLASIPLTHTHLTQATVEAPVLHLGGITPAGSPLHLPDGVADLALSALARAEVVEQKSPDVNIARKELAQLLTTTPTTAIEAPVAPTIPDTSSTPTAPATEDDIPVAPPVTPTTTPLIEPETAPAIPTADAVTAATANLEAALAAQTTTPEVTPAPPPVDTTVTIETFLPQVPAGDFVNGQTPTAALCAVEFAPSAQLRCEAAAALAVLNADFHAEFGQNITITDSYRTYADQVAVKASRGYLAATPGTSNHGYGIAVDLGGGINTFGSAQHRWMTEHADATGWIQPDWASANGTKPEAWHWEYQP